MHDLRFPPRNIDEFGALLGYYAAYSDNSSPNFRDNLSAPLMTLEDGTDRLSRNVGKELPLYPAKYYGQAQISSNKFLHNQKKKIA